MTTQMMFFFLQRIFSIAFLYSWNDKIIQNEINECQKSMQWQHNEQATAAGVQWSVKFRFLFILANVNVYCSFLNDLSVNKLAILCLSHFLLRLLVPSKIPFRTNAKKKSETTKNKTRFESFWNLHLTKIGKFIVWLKRNDWIRYANAIRYSN